MKKIRDCVATLLMLCLRIIPIDRKKVIFKSFRGESYSDNPKAIYEALKNLRPDLHYVWVLKDTKQKIDGAKVVKNGSIGEMINLATAKLWVDNTRKGIWIKKRKNQFYLQTWHAGISNKKGEGDAEDSLTTYYIKGAKHDSKLADYFISGSDWQTKGFEKTFWYHNKILKSGLPRSDIFYENPTTYKDRVFTFYNLDREVHLALYAPTFREMGNLNYYINDYEVCIQKLEERFGGIWKMVVRLHPNIANQYNEIIYSEKVLNGSKYSDINELIIASDMVISDYSSCMFDAMEAGKRVVLYTSDSDKYRLSRGAYFSPEELPFLAASTLEDLCNLIQDFDEQLYTKKVKCFMKQVGIYNDGNVSMRVVDFLLENVFET